MIEKTIIKTITKENYSNRIVELYHARQHSKILSLKVQSQLPNYYTYTYPTDLSSENTEELNDAIITTHSHDSAQILINLFLSDLEKWHFVRSEFIVNYGGVIETPILGSYISDFGHFVLERGFALGVHIQCLEHPLGAGDVITVIGDAETAPETTSVQATPSVPQNIYFAAPALPLPNPREGLILDNYPGACAGFSLRKLTEGYDGPLVRVRRADGEEADIGFSDDRLNLDELLDFASGSSSDGDVEILIWYDQTGQYGHLYAPDPSEFIRRPLIVRYYGEYELYSSRGLGIRLINGEYIADTGNYRNLPSIYFQRHSFLRGSDNVPVLGDASRRMVIFTGPLSYGYNSRNFNHYLCGWGGYYSPDFYGVTYYTKSSKSRSSRLYLSLGRKGTSPSEYPILTSDYNDYNIICSSYYRETGINHFSVDGGGDVGGYAQKRSDIILKTTSGPLTVGGTTIDVSRSDRRTGDFRCYEVLLWGAKTSLGAWVPSDFSHWDVTVDIDIFYPHLEVAGRRYSRPDSIFYDV